MKKLLQLNVTANWGSTGKIAEGIGLAAQRRGWSSYIAYGRYMNPSASYLIKVGNQADVYSHYAINRIFDGEGLGSKRATRKLISQIDTLSPSVIHLHNIHDHWLNYPLLFDYLKTITTPVVWTFHDCWAFTGGCPHFVEVGCTQWQTECRQCPANHNLIDNSKQNFKRKLDSILSLGDRLTIVSVSSWLDSLVLDSRLGHLNHTYIYNGLDTELFKFMETCWIDDKYGLKGKHVLLGVSSVWNESKGLNDYFALSRLLPENFIIVLIGIDKSKHTGFPSNILAIPRTDDTKELASLYSRADAVLSLSKAETFGLTLAEGLACGTPSIGYAATAVKEIISTETGIAVEPGNISQVKDAAIQIATKKIVFNQDVCRRKAEESFNQNIQFVKYIDLYEELLT